MKPNGLRPSRKKAKVSEEKTSSKEKAICEQGVHDVNLTKEFVGEVAVADVEDVVLTWSLWRRLILTAARRERMLLLLPWISILGISSGAHRR
jgi:hypothetical protein